VALQHLQDWDRNQQWYKYIVHRHQQPNHCLVITHHHCHHPPHPLWPKPTNPIYWEQHPRVLMDPRIRPLPSGTHLRIITPQMQPSMIMRTKRSRLH
jgi:hypothetical protein